MADNFVYYLCSDAFLGILLLQNDAVSESPISLSAFRIITYNHFSCIR